jgi:copper chaperone CopZ
MMGRRTAILYLLTIAISAVCCGLLLDWIFFVSQSAVPQLDAHVHQHEMGTNWLSAFWAIVLLLVIGYSYLRSPRKEKGLVLDEESNQEESNMSGSAENKQRLEFEVSGMTCNHCAETVGRTLRQLPGVSQAEVSLKQARAVVVGEHLDPAGLSEAVKSLGYDMRLIIK